MKIPSGRTFLVFLVLMGRLAAGEWSRWETLDGEKIAARVGAVEIRSRRDEAGDQMEKGYLFIYEIHNGSDSHAAKVALAFPLLDPASQTWADIDSDKPTVILSVPPLGTVTANQYSPSSHVLKYSSTIFWPDGIPPPKNLEDLAANAAKPTETEAAQKTFDGVSLSDNAALKKAVEKHKDRDTRFRATIVFQIPPGETSWMELDENGVGYARDGTWRQSMDSWFSFVQKPLVIDGRSVDYRLQILSVTATEMTVHFEDVPVDELGGYLSSDPSNEAWLPTKPLVLELALLKPGEKVSSAAPEGKATAATGPRGNPENGPADQGPEKFIHASQPAGKDAPPPAAKSGRIEVQAVTHSGYWFDPDDKDAKGDDPVIYVRIAGQAKRVRLSGAKEAYGVPKNATRDTMSHYSERQDKVLIDRGTHRP